MSKSDDNTNELESYGVWVKNTSGEDAAPKAETADTSDELNLDDGGLDLPDFDDSDFSDMFKEEPEADAAAGLDDFGSEDDTTLSTDELANITDGFEVEQVDAPAENESEDGDSGDLGDLGAFEITESIEEPVAEESSDDLNFDIDTAEDTTESEEINFDEEISFDGDDSGTEEAAVTEESSGDEEISLDDFMDGGFSDESVASGNNGYEPGAQPDIPVSSDTEELSLDDFMDGESFDSGSENKEEAVIEDEAPLDMDISFDDSADSVETEDNVSLEFTEDDADEDTDSTEAVETEEVSVDDFGSGFGSDDSTPFVPDASSEKINTEEVDLSDFGVDADAEETPIVQDVEEAKNKEKIVDYDLAVGNENTATAPVVNEIKTDTAEDIEEAAPLADEVLNEAPAAPADNSLLQQIVSELSDLKNEMNKLKTNLEEIKTQDKVALAAGAGLAAGAAAASLANDDIDPEKAAEKEDKGGFFSDDDGDDTIALSFDELDNIMNTAEFSDTVEAGESSEAAENSIEEIDTTNTEIEEVVDNPDDTVIDESVITSDFDTNEASDSVDSEIENAISDEKDTSLDDINFDEGQSENFDFSDEKLEEPKIDEFIPDGNDELYEGEELPDEIAIPKEDDLLVESNSSDFMDSVKETSEQDETSAEFIAEEADELDTTDLPSELPDDIPTVDKVLAEEVEEPAAAPESASFAEVDNLDNNLSESNLVYLDKQTSGESSSETIANTELKQDIKSVLLYMDQLLENLPEDKIVEFAKSDEFVTYKKLFNELGLS